jgi:hypothetical protein
MKKNKFIKSLFAILMAIISFYSCNNKNENPENKIKIEDHILDDYMKFNYLRTNLESNVLFFLKQDSIICDSVTFVSDYNRFYDSTYFIGFLNHASEILIKETMDSSLLNKEYLISETPNEWFSETNSNCKVFCTKIWHSTDSLVQFTYVYIPQVQKKFKCLITRKNVDSDWELKSIGM